MSGNGADIAAVYQLLSEVARKVAEHDRRFDQIAARLEEVTADIAGLRETVANYHSSVVGHGIMFSKLEERMIRVERHLNLNPIED
ncbi:MAG TPA: hypothetical protein VJ770_20455 [Stellaceae bacterium]|nr:hypothetical protein [Stellaceae bacterium]